jgi:ketosteroid isomerase-like protein
MTVWKRQEDGTWRFVLDLGINNPEPKTAVTPSFTSLFGKFNRSKIAIARASLLTNELNFSKLSAERGAVEAFLKYSAPDVRLFRNDHQPFVGRRNAVRALQPLAVAWTWTPAFGDVSSSGDLGYSYGTYELREKSSGKILESGNYAHVWKKERGVWKVVIDVANPIPPEAKS